MRRIVFLVVTLFAPVYLAAQGSPALTAGARVRFWESGRLGAGRVAVVSAVSGDTLSLRLDHQSEPVRLRLAALDRLELSAGRSRSRWNGSMLGFGIGAILGAGIGYTTGDGTAPICELRCNTRPIDALAGAILGGLLGAGVGAIVGVRHERWLPVPVPPH